VLENALRDARVNGWQSVVFCFSNHPQSLLSQSPPKLLSSAEQRLSTFEQMGFDHAVMIPFDTQIQHVSPRQFVETILIHGLNAHSVTVGYDFRFGEHGAGETHFLAQCGTTFGFKAQIIQPIRSQDQIISSTIIRKLLTYGDLEQANRLLGYPYRLEGTVIQGDGRGRTIGFPTANLAIAPERLIPATGTYSGIATVSGKKYPAVCHIGTCPTFLENQLEKRVEIHVLDYQGEAFYGTSMQFEFLHKLRDEQKFNSADALVAQIHQDCAKARVVAEQWQEQSGSEPREEDGPVSFVNE
jgi:riboflavin kinase/FMN adenylyltransferase